VSGGARLECPPSTQIGFAKIALGGRALKAYSLPGDPVYSTMMFSSLEGCELLQFNPSLTVIPDSTRADEASGFVVEQHFPQGPQQFPALIAPELRETTVTLPAGVSLNPASADGLEGCTNAQMDLGSGSLAACPNASQVGTIEGETPLLKEPLKGEVFLGTPNCDPCRSADASDGNMYRFFVQLAGSGTVIKQEGRGYANPVMGQLTATFKNLPQLPASNLKLHFNNGLRSGLAVADNRNIPEPAKSFGVIQGVAVDPANGDIYVSDYQSATVTKFDSSGVFQFQLTGSETPQGSFSPFGVAVDPLTRDLIVADTAHEVIDRFTSSGGYAGQFPAPIDLLRSREYRNALAVGPEGDIYLGKDGEVTEYSPTGTPVTCPGGKNSLPATSGAVAVDPSDGHIFVEESFSIAEYSSLCATAPSAKLGENEGYSVGFGIGVSASTHQVYANPGGDFVLTFGLLTVPSVEQRRRHQLRPRHGVHDRGIPRAGHPGTRGAPHAAGPSRRSREAAVHEEGQESEA
jgi:hypothetical protein